MEANSDQHRRSGRIVAALALALAALAAAAAVADGAVRLEPRRIALENKNLFDLTVADYDRDSRSDVLTTNHSQAGSVLRNRGRGRFADRTLGSGLDLDPEFPGLADLTRTPDLSRPGLYIYARPSGRYEVRRVGEFSGGTKLAGSISFRTGVSVAAKENAAVALRRNGAAEPPITRVDFELPADGSRAVLDPPFLDVPVKVTIKQPLPLAQVFVGSRAVVPATRTFELRLPDRHGFAVADLNGDGLRDVWVTTGGNKGQIDKYQGLIEDEVFINTGTRFEARGRALGIRKGTCRGRTAEAVDFDGDGLLDLFASCAEDDPKLYRQLVDGLFVDVSETLSAAGNVGGSEYRWADVRGTRRPELIVARASSFEVFAYRSRGDRFARVDRVGRSAPGNVRRLLIADYDNDGDQDVFASSPAGNSLLRNDDGNLRNRALGGLGLPERAAAAAWVDYNNDGRTDLHAVPSGLYRQRGDGTFKATGLGSIPEAGNIYAPTVWFDLENDGDRDLLSIYKREGRLKRAVRLFASKGVRNHWLWVDLTGSGRNTDAIGAEVRLRVGGRRLTQLVGAGDSSRHSRGDLRLYFGLGGRSRVDRLVVTWPDGSRTVRRNVRADRVLSLSQ